MALRLRRGTDAERLIMEPPVAGELIYTTDTKAVWVGDGTTPGGLPVSGSALGIDDLGNVTVTAPNDGDILKWNGTAWVNTPQESLEKPGNIYGTDSTLLIDTDNSVIVGPIVANTPIIGDLVGDVTGTLVGDVVGDVTGNVIGNVTGNVSGVLDGDVVGSVFGDDSSVLVDGPNNRHIINSALTTSGFMEWASGFPGERTVRITADTGRSILQLVYEDDTQDLSSANLSYGSLSFGRVDTNGINITGLVTGRSNGLFMSAGTDPNGAFPSDNYLVLRGDTGFVGIGVFQPTEKLDVRGNAVISGTVDAASFRGSLVSDTSTTIIDAVDGSLQVANVNLVGQTGNAPATPGTVDSWLEVSVNGATKYIPLYA